MKVNTLVGRVGTYVAAAGAVAIATLGTFAIQPWMGPSVSILFFPAVVIPAMYGGRSA